jgi:hypothetical protein
MIPEIVLIIIATTGNGGVAMEQVAFQTLTACNRTAEQIRQTHNMKAFCLVTKDVRIIVK